MQSLQGPFTSCLDQKRLKQRAPIRSDLSGSCLANQSSIANELIISRRLGIILNKVIKHNRLIKWIFLHN